MQVFNPIFIHSDNLSPDIDITSYKNIKFNFEYSTSVTLDKYISDIILPVLLTEDFNVIFIKDSLSTNYLDFYGLILAHHIRLSLLLDEKRFLPIIILSDIDALLINKFTTYGRILFTKNVSIKANTLQTLEDSKQHNFSDWDTEIDLKIFLDTIHLELSAESSSRHSIANKWSLYRWALLLNIDLSGNFSHIKDTILTTLYFKYLTCKYHAMLTNSQSAPSLLPNVDSSNVLYIDDEWNIGWKEIFTHYFNQFQNTTLNVLEQDFKDQTQDDIISLIINDIKSKDPDIVILDLRLHDNDFSNSISENDLSGIKILKYIKENINPGIQVILLTASGKSTILEKAYEHKILGYIKKEHPDDKKIVIENAVEKFNKLLFKGFSNQYLKKIYLTKCSIHTILKNNRPFKKYPNLEEEKIKNATDRLVLESSYIYDILESNTENKFNYAVVSLVTCFETILKTFVMKSGNGHNALIFWDKEEHRSVRSNGDLEDKLEALYLKLCNYELTSKNTVKLIISFRHNYVHNLSRNTSCTHDNICEWFEVLHDMLNILDRDAHKYSSVSQKKNELVKIFKKVNTSYHFLCPK